MFADFNSKFKTEIIFIKNYQKNYRTVSSDDKKKYLKMYLDGTVSKFEEQSFLVDCNKHRQEHKKMRE